MHNCRIRTSNLVHTFSSHYHYAASVDTSVLQMSVTRFIFNRPCSSPRAHSRHLTAGVGPLSDIRCGTSRNARAGHDSDIAGPGLHLEVRVLACQ